MTETGPGGDGLKGHPARDGLLSDCRIDTHDVQKPGGGGIGGSSTLLCVPSLSYVQCTGRGCQEKMGMGVSKHA